MPVIDTTDEEELARLAQYGPGQGYPYDTAATETGPVLPSEVRGRFFAGEADGVTPIAPLPGGTMNAALAAQGIQNVPQGDVNYSDSDKYLIRRNEDERLVALGINPVAYRKQQADAEEGAVRYQGQQEYQALVTAGRSPEEALRATLGKLTYGHADKLAAALQRTRSPLDLETKSVNGQTFYRTSQGGWAHMNDQTGARQDRLEQTISKEERDQLGRKLSTLEKAAQQPVNIGNTEIADQIKTITDQLSQSRSNALNAARSPTSSSAPAPMPKEVKTEKLVSVISPDGKVGTIPSANLQDALKAGYKKR